MLLRCEKRIDEASKKKVALFCNVSDEAVISVEDVPIIYQVALNLQKQHLDDLIVNHLRLKCGDYADMSDWVQFIEKIRQLKSKVSIALVGKYVELHDAYISVAESLKYASYAFDKKVDIHWVNSEEINENNINELLSGVSGIIVPGGFGNRGIQGKIAAIRYARTKNIPYLGLCLGMQLALIEYARDVLKIPGADSTEFNPNTEHNIIDLMPDQEDVENMGGTQRLGSYPCRLKAGTKAAAAYDQEGRCSGYTRYALQGTRIYAQEGGG